MTQRYDKEFKLHAVRLVADGGQSGAETARQLGIPSKTLYKWINDYKQDPHHHFVGSGNLKPKDQKLRELQKRNRELEEENAILKKATSIFAKNHKSSIHS